MPHTTAYVSHLYVRSWLLYSAGDKRAAYPARGAWDILRPSAALDLRLKGVFILVYMRHHTTIYLSSYYCMCPNTTIYVYSYYYVSSYSCIRVLILLYMCPYTTRCVRILRYVCPHTPIYRVCRHMAYIHPSPYYYICYNYVCPHPTIYVSPYYYTRVPQTPTCVLILLYMCPHTAIQYPHATI